jgi:hypothetical protein
LAAKNGKAVASMSPQLQKAVSRRMCGGVYEALYSTDQAVINKSLGAFFGKVETTSQEIQQMNTERR